MSFERESKKIRAKMVARISTLLADKFCEGNQTMGMFITVQDNKERAVSPIEAAHAIVEEILPLLGDPRCPDCVRFVNHSHRSEDANSGRNTSPLTRY